MENYFYSIPEAANICFVARQTMWRWVKSGELKGFLTPGGKYKIRKEDLHGMEGEIMKLIKEKPGLSVNAYMGLIMKEFKGKISGKEVSEIIKKYVK